jgi:hypothetical protein
LSVAVMLLSCAANALAAAPLTSMAAAFTPDRLGAATTITIQIRIDPKANSMPLAVSSVQLGFPSNLGLATSGLGLASCDPDELALADAKPCPANSRMGSGSATVAVSFGPNVVYEHVTLGLFAAPSTDGFLHLSILAIGTEPVSARIVMSAILLPGRLRITVPEVPSLPGAPDVALVAIRATLGGALTYYERRGGRKIAYRPQGIGLPDSCPRGGWRLAAALVFMDGEHSRAGTTISCPPRRR